MKHGKMLQVMFWIILGGHSLLGKNILVMIQEESTKTVAKYALRPPRTCMPLGAAAAKAVSWTCFQKSILLKETQGIKAEAWTWTCVQKIDAQQPKSIPLREIQGIKAEAQMVYQNALISIGPTRVLKNGTECETG